MARSHSRRIETAAGSFEVTRRPNSRGSNLVDQEQPSIIVSGPGVFEFMGRWSTLCGVPTAEGDKVTVNALDATDEQIVWALTHDESIFKED